MLKPMRMTTWELAMRLPLSLTTHKPALYTQGPYIGTTDSGRLFCLDTKSMAHNGHILLSGSSGAGKSSTLMSYVARSWALEEGRNFVIIDDSGEHAGWVRRLGGNVIDMSKHSFNFFKPAHRPLPDAIAQQMNMFSMLELTTPGRNGLLRCIVKAYESKGFKLDDPGTWNGGRQEPTPEDVIKTVKAEIQNSDRPTATSLTALSEKLESVFYGPLGMFGGTYIDLDVLWGGLVLLDMSKITSDARKGYIAGGILSHLEGKMHDLGLDSGKSMTVGMEEVWKERLAMAVLESIVRTGRKYNFSVLMTSQRLWDVPDSIIANVGTVIAHRAEHPKDLDFLEKHLLLTKEQRGRVKSAAKGEALVKSGNITEFVSVDKEEMADIPAVSGQDNADGRDSAGQTLFHVPISITNENNGRGEISHNARKLLEEIAIDPGSTITEYYRQTGLGRRKGDKAKDELVAAELAKDVKLPVKGPDKTLELTDKGRQLLNLKPDKRHGGAIHHWMIKQIMKKFDGHDLVYEMPVDGGQTDLVIDNCLAVECESRDFNPTNISKNIDAGFEKVIIITVTKAQAEAFNLKIQEAFPNETKAEAVDISSFLDTPESYIGAEA